MDGFLVVLRHTMDDIPLRLFHTKAAAVKFAQKVDLDGAEREKRILDIDASNPVSVCIYVFVNGRLLDWFPVHSFDEDTAPDLRIARTE